jgi:hypothetical protein
MSNVPLLPCRPPVAGRSPTVATTGGPHVRCAHAARRPGSDSVGQPARRRRRPGRGTPARPDGRRRPGHADPDQSGRSPLAGGAPARPHGPPPTGPGVTHRRGTRRGGALEPGSVRWRGGGRLPVGPGHPGHEGHRVDACPGGDPTGRLRPDPDPRGRRGRRCRRRGGRRRGRRVAGPRPRRPGRVPRGRPATGGAGRRRLRAVRPAGPSGHADRRRREGAAGHPGTRDRQPGPRVAATCGPGNPVAQPVRGEGGRPRHPTHPPGDA